MSSSRREVLEKIPKRCLEDVKEYIDKIDKALDNLEKLEDKERISWAFKALSNTVKLDIVMLLSATEMPVCLISYILEKDQSLISHHLSDLKTAGLVKERVRGKFRVYGLEKDALIDLFDRIGRIVKG